jgi:predicted CXXCH cytochrome family protein
MAVVLAAIAAGAVLALWALSSSPTPAEADHISPHLSSGATSGNCSACHRSHSGKNNESLQSAPESTVCLSCHDGTGADSNIAAEYNDATVPADDVATSSFYAHRLDLSGTHTSNRLNEFGGRQNRHSACSDCHDSHKVSAGLSAETANGWTASGALNNITGVNSAAAWKDPISYEYELCLKCHSRFTILRAYTPPSYKKTDKAAELDPSNNSYHPIEAPGKNTTPAMQASLDGGKVWQLSTGSTIRCTQTADPAPEVLSGGITQSIA